MKRDPTSSIIGWRGKDEHVVQEQGIDKYIMSSICKEILEKKASKWRENNKKEVEDKINPN